MKHTTGSAVGLPLLAAAMLASSPAAAQVSTVSGRVLDAVVSQPVANAVVTLESRVATLLPDLSGRVTAVLSVVTGASGAYRFSDLPPGLYVVRVERIGYRPATVAVDIGRPADASVSVALELEPVSLEPLAASQRSSSWFQRASNVRDEPEIARISAEQQRQADYLSADTRALTYADVMDGVTLGEGDVLRALQRFAGVGTRDDYTAELWIRGAPWTQTRVTYDGVPLFNPVHAIGILSAFTPETLGAVIFHPGMRPASSGEGAAGLVELRTRAGGGSGAVRGVADISPASAKLVLDQRIGDSAAWVVAARRSHLHLLRRGLDVFGMDTLDLPFAFHDVAARGDVALGGARLEISGIHEQDRLTGDVPGVLERTRAHWGNSAGRVTLAGTRSGLALTQTVGVSRFRALIDARAVTTREPGDAWAEPETNNGIDYALLAGSIAATGAGRWSAGYDVAWQRVRYRGPFPRHHAVRPDTLLHVDYERELAVAALWARTRVLPAPRVAIDPGVRVEASRTLANARPVRLSPRIALRVELSAAHTASLSIARVWQHTQAIGLAGPSIHPAFHASHFWIWADDRMPAIRADIINIGTERWLGGGWLVSVNGYMRDAAGMAAVEPRAGRLGRRPLFVTADNRARGLEASVRRIGARWSASAGYTLSRSDLIIRDTSYASPADRRHVVDLTAAARVWRGLRISSAFTSMSGAPFTRAYSRSAQDCTAFGFGCDDPTGSYVERYNGERTGPYRALDLAMTWTWQLRGTDLSAYAQVKNVLGRDNASTYAGSVPVARVATPDGPMIVFADRFEPGLSRLPLIGLRLAF
jgi:hypothetical protein